jgi:hypothetical protein
LAGYDRWGKRVFVEPKVQYDATQDVYFMLDWNQTSYEGEVAGLLEWPNLFVERNKLEAKCRNLYAKVPKARSMAMIHGRRENRLHGDVCRRLIVEIRAMMRRVMRQTLIKEAMRDAEKNGSDPMPYIRSINRDPQYGSDPEVSDFSE